MTNFLNKIQLDNQKILFIGIACVVLIYFDFAFIAKLQLDSLKNTKPKITKLKKDLDVLSKDLRRMQDLKNKQAEVSKVLLAKAKKIISEEQISALLRDISDIANKNSVKIEQIKPSKETQVKSDKNVPPPKFTSLSINLELSCDYHNLGKFINILENADTYIAVQKLNITPKQANYITQKATLELRVYVKK